MGLGVIKTHGAHDKELGKSGSLVLLREQAEDALVSVLVFTYKFFYKYIIFTEAWASSSMSSKNQPPYIYAYIIGINYRQLEISPISASEFPGAHLQSLQLQIAFSLLTTMRTSGGKVGHAITVSKNKKQNKKNWNPFLLRCFLLFQFKFPAQFPNGRLLSLWLLEMGTLKGFDRGVWTPLQQ